MRTRWLRCLALAVLTAFASGSAVALSDAWLHALGGAAFEQSFRVEAPVLLKSALTPERFADEAAAGAAFVNAYKLSHDPLYLNRAKEIAAFLAGNANLAGDGIPGWGRKFSAGYGFCPDANDFRGKDLWETTRALNAILKVAEVAPSGADIEITRKAVDSWPSEERRLDAPYASRGMRFYPKEPGDCARKYVKNTNIAMGEVLYRLARVTGEKAYERRAEQVLNAELWEILARKNFGYHGAMIYVDSQNPQNIEMRKAEQRKVRIDADGRIVCRNDPPDASCSDHLAFEAYELYQVELISGRDLSEPIDKIMSAYRTSPLGETLHFPWQSRESPTHITAYNCYMRNSASLYRDECQRALSHNPRGSMIFYGLLPDDLTR